MTLSIKIFRLNVILGSVAQLSRSQPSVEMVYFRHDCFFFFVVICIVFFRFAFVFCFLFIFSPLGIDLFGSLSVVPTSNRPGIRFFVYCIFIIMWHSHLNDMEIPETKRFIAKGFELGTTLS